MAAKVLKPKAQEKPMETKGTFNPAIAAQMDKAAEDALKEFEPMIEDKKLAEGVKAVMKWWSKNYKTAGHKRLGRGLNYLTKSYGIK